MSQSLAIGSKTTATRFNILWAISFCHMLNDLLQSLLPAIGLLTVLLPDLSRLPVEARG